GSELRLCIVARHVAHHALLFGQEIAVCPGQHGLDLLGALLSVVDAFLGLLVEVVAHLLRVLERLHFGAAEVPLLRALGRLRTLRGRVGGRCLGPAAAREHEDREASPRGPAVAHARTALTRCRMSARTFGGRWFQRTPATAPARARHAGTLLRSGFARRSCSQASQKPTRISASSESMPTERSSAARLAPMFGVRSMGV